MEYGVEPLPSTSWQKLLNQLLIEIFSRQLEKNAKSSAFKKGVHLQQMCLREDLLNVKTQILHLPCLSDKRGLSGSGCLMSVSCSFMSARLVASTQIDGRPTMYVFQPPQDTALISQCQQHVQILHFDLNCKYWNTLALYRNERYVENRFLQGDELPQTVHNLPCVLSATRLV